MFEVLAEILFEFLAWAFGSFVAWGFGAIVGVFWSPSSSSWRRYRYFALACVVGGVLSFAAAIFTTSLWGWGILPAVLIGLSLLQALAFLFAGNAYRIHHEKLHSWQDGAKPHRAKPKRPRGEIPPVTVANEDG